MFLQAFSQTGSSKEPNTICPKTITLQNNLSCGQSILGAIAQRLHHRNCLEIIFGRRNSYRGFECDFCHNSGDLGVWENQFLAPKRYFVHLRN